MIKVCVTGASGFIGSHLCNYLKGRGYWVRAIDWKPPEFGDVVCDEYNWQCDLRLPISTYSAFEGIDHVYALGADMGGMGFISDHHYIIARNNLMINLITAEAAATMNVKKILFTSSACVYPERLQLEEKARKLKESDAWTGEPDTAYGIEKLFAEDIYQRLAEKTGIQIRLPRFYNIYGPYGTWMGGREKLPAAACRKVAVAKLNGDHRVEVWGDGLATRNFCYISDCLEMIYLLMQSDYSQPMNIGTDRLITVNGVFDVVAEIADIEIEKVHVPGYQGVRGRNADLTLMRNILKYEPQVSLEEGLAKTYNWIEQEVQR
jgi:nucleoside-diphosphate-sugar epimerase